MSDDDRQDLLNELSDRRLVGEGTTDRLAERRGPSRGARARLFERVGQPDPWDPDARPLPVGLGSVALKFGERRDPAAARRMPKAKPRGASSAARSPQQSVGPAKPTPSPQARPPTPRPPTPRPPARQAAPERSAASEPPGAVGEGGAPAPDVDRRPPMPAPRRAAPKSGRVRIGSRTHATGPRIKKIASAPPAPTTEPAAAPPPTAGPTPAPAAPSPRAAPPKDVGLDDLFGFTGGRLKARRDE